MWQTRLAEELGDWQKTLAAGPLAVPERVHTDSAAEMGGETEVQANTEAGIPVVSCGGAHGCDFGNIKIHSLTAFEEGVNCAWPTPGRFRKEIEREDAWEVDQWRKPFADELKFTASTSASATEKRVVPAMPTLGFSDRDFDGVARDRDSDSTEARTRAFRRILFRRKTSDLFPPEFGDVDKGRTSAQGALADLLEVQHGTLRLPKRAADTAWVFWNPTRDPRSVFVNREEITWFIRKTMATGADGSRSKSAKIRHVAIGALAFVAGDLTSTMGAARHWHINHANSILDPHAGVLLTPRAVRLVLEHEGDLVKAALAQQIRFGSDPQTLRLGQLGKLQLISATQKLVTFPQDGFPTDAFGAITAHHPDPGASRTTLSAGVPELPRMPAGGLSVATILGGLWAVSNLPLGMARELAEAARRRKRKMRNLVRNWRMFRNEQDRLPSLFRVRRTGLYAGAVAFRDRAVKKKDMGAAENQDDQAAGSGQATAGAGADPSSTSSCEADVAACQGQSHNEVLQCAKEMATYGDKFQWNPATDSQAAVQKEQKTGKMGTIRKKNTVSVRKRVFSQKRGKYVNAEITLKNVKLPRRPQASGARKPSRNADEPTRPEAHHTKAPYQYSFHPAQLLNPLNNNSTTSLHYIHGNNHIQLMRSAAPAMREFRRHQILYGGNYGGMGGGGGVRYERDPLNYTTVIADKRDSRGENEFDDMFADEEIEARM